MASVLRLYLNDEETFREVCPRLKTYLTLWFELNSDLAYAIVAPRSRIKSTARTLAIWHFPLFFFCFFALDMLSCSEHAFRF